MGVATILSIVPDETYRRVAGLLSQMEKLIGELERGDDAQEDLAALEARLRVLIDQRQLDIYERGRKKPWARSLRWHSRARSA